MHLKTLLFITLVFYKKRIKLACSMLVAVSIWLTSRHIYSSPLQLFHSVRRRYRHDEMAAGEPQTGENGDGNSIGIPIPGNEGPLPTPPPPLMMGDNMDKDKLNEEMEREVERELGAMGRGGGGTSGPSASCVQCMEDVISAVCYCGCAVAVAQCCGECLTSCATCGG